MSISFELVRARIDARLAEREARRKRREQQACLEACADEMCACLDAAASGGEIRPRPRRLGAGLAFRCCGSAPRLPEELQVPSVESRPPNLKSANLSFAARLVIAVRDKFAGEAPKVYTAAKVSRQAYSQIVSDETRPVSKRTAIRFAFALKSTPEEARLLLKSAGYAFSNSQTEDVILQACLEVNPPIWDLEAVNLLLKEYRVDFQY